DENNRFINNRIVARGKMGVVDIFTPEEIDYMDVSPKQIVSVGTAMIPFLENDDANRALMGSNMQRQAVPLLKTEAPIIGTGIEYKAAKDSGGVVIAKNSGIVEKVSADEILIRRDKDGQLDKYKLLKFKRSNQGTTINQRPIVKLGERVTESQIIADGPSTDQGEIALGKNLLIAFMTWEGYNYEDAVLLNERLVIEDVLTSVHIEEYESEARDTKLGPEE
ncbi:DNA-directed RNA polymerase subunit beta, partial [Vibrio parahaemolyticus]|nr:DNA-directed RNA polymerase subunit beta [Vibrio parahaemolyticus]